MTDHPWVFDNQRKAWQEVEQAIAGLEQARVILLAQPQVGKTSFMIWGAIQRANWAKSQGKPYLNIIAIADANNALRDQTIADLENALRQAGMMSERNRFWVEHRLNLQHMTFPAECVLTVFTDEAHIAARVEGGRDRFQQKVYAHPGNRLLVDVGATSFAHMALHEQVNSPYDAAITLQPGPAYNSVEHMYEMGRIRQVDPLVNRDGSPTDFLRERLSVLQRHGGYTLIRATGKRHIKVASAIKAISPNMPIIEADMFKFPTVGKHIMINQITKQLAIAPKQPTVIMVRGALRVGIVLKPSLSNNICELVDTNSLRADTVTQSFVGRSCGYHKRNDTYGIFTNLKDVEHVIDFYNEVQGAVPIGLKNKGAKRTGIYEVIPQAQAQALVNQGMHVSKCSANNEHDVCDEVMRNINSWEKRLVFLDKPNENHRLSWVWLKMKHPEFIGKYLQFNAGHRAYSGAEVHENFIDLNYLRDELDVENE